MYGLVNKLLHDFLVDEHCVDLPQVDYDVFKQYEDSITFDLLNEGVTQTHATSEELLIGFGVYFIEAAFKFYPYLLRDHGQTLGDLLLNLNRLHRNAKQIFSAYSPPHFSVTPIGDTGYRVVYTSEREGLEPMVLGLLMGCVLWFDEDYTVTRIGDSNEFSLHRPE